MRHTHTDLQLCHSRSSGDSARPPGLPLDDRGALRRTQGKDRELLIWTGSSALPGSAGSNTTLDRVQV